GVTQDVGPGHASTLFGADACAVHHEWRAVVGPRRIDFLLVLAGPRLQRVELLPQAGGQPRWVDAVEVPRVEPSGHHVGLRRREGVGQGLLADLPLHPLPEGEESLLPGGGERPLTSTRVADEAVRMHEVEERRGRLAAYPDSRLPQSYEGQAGTAPG